MFLAAAFRRSFDPESRRRGEDLLAVEQVELLWRGEDSVSGAAHEDGAIFYPYLKRRGTIGMAGCDCSVFVGGAFCEHIWAILVSADDHNLFRDRRGRIPDLLIRDPNYGLEGPSWASQKPVRFSPPPPPKPSWDKVIDRAFSAAGMPAKKAAWPEHRYFYYLINLQCVHSHSTVHIDLITRDRKANGELTRCKPVRLPRKQIPSLPDAADREILGIMAGVDGEFSYSGSELPKSVHVEAYLAHMLLPKISATGRLMVHCSSSTLDSAEAATYDPGTPWQFALRVRRDDAVYRLGGGFRRGEEWIDFPSGAEVHESGFLRWQGRLSLVDWAGQEQWRNFFKSTPSVEVPLGDGDALLAKLLGGGSPPVLEVPEELQFERVHVAPKPHLKVLANARSDGKRLPAKLTFRYGEHEVPRTSGKMGFFHAPTRQLVVRDTEAEQSAVARLAEQGLKELPHASGQPDWEVPARKLPVIVRDLIAADFDVEAEGKLIKRAGGFQLGVTSGIDWFELNGQVDYDGQVVKLPELLKSLRRGETMVRLGDGSFGLLPEEWLNRLGLLPSLGELGEGLRFRRNQTGFLDALLVAQPEATFDEGFARARAELRRFEGVKPAVQPATFQGTLRGYQLEGVGWFEFLRQFGFGGCLADDMGVGKTAQVLGMLEARRGSVQRPSLVVAPKSLIFNWKQEAARFTPGLRVFDYTGMGRSQDGIADHDLILTTYGTLLRDVAELREILFDYVVLDEAQAIKNSSTETAKAARLLRSEHRLALSGTPVENHLGELWSLFEFLNPGMLGTASVFKAAGASARNPDEATRQVLARALRPFILRRTKEQVVSELPEKSEQTLYCELEPAQRKVYDELRDHYRARLLKLVDDQGLAQSKIQVLEALLRLRQAACHPRLMANRTYKGPSAKLEMLLLQLEEIRQSGRKALVFSQFTGLLAILRETLDTDGVRYAYLDGKTADRQAAVREFQEDPECLLFLISLKAGGLGLNLTAAEYVFLLDPWWNPAVEAQAIDRAHRIGQQRRVFAYRLIARDTVEEKVLELQRTKRALADSIISGDNSLIANLGREELELLLS